MTLSDEIAGMPDAGNRGPRLTRRALAFGVAAAAAAAAFAPGLRLLTAQASSASKADGASGACAAQAAASPAADAPQVVIANFTFSPDTLTVPVGTTVTWLNKDDIPHTVTSDDTKTFASSLLDTGDTFSFEFKTAGTFPYFCSVHPMMTAKVVVKA